MTYVGNNTKQVNDYLASLAEEIEGLEKEIQEKSFQDNNQNIKIQLTTYHIYNWREHPYWLNLPPAQANKNIFNTFSFNSCNIRIMFSYKLIMESKDPQIRKFGF